MFTLFQCIEKYTCKNLKKCKLKYDMTYLEGKIRSKTWFNREGHQTPTQTQRIAYQDAFINVLNTLPHEEEQGYYNEDWLTRRVKAAQSWLVAQGLHQPK